MKIIWVQLLVLFFWNSGCAAVAAKKECSKAEAIEAERLAATLKTWDEVHRAFLKFGHCDDGAIGEGFSESVRQLMANKWQAFPELHLLTMRDASFESFVLKHLDETLAGEITGKIRDNVRAHCPKGATEFCRKAASAVEQ